MANDFGPWATLIVAGRHPQLSAFWKRRLTMLVGASQTSPVLSRRSLAWLVAVGVLMSALPTFRAASALADEKEQADTGKASAGSSAAAGKEGDKKPGEMSLQLEKREGTWKLPNGEKMFVIESTVSNAGSAKPKDVEVAKRQHQEMRQLIAQKKFKLVKTFEAKGGEKQYVYRFNFADGDHMAMNFSMPLENVTSWDDYARKSEEQQRRRQENINKAIEAGKYRLLNVEVIQIHVCRDGGFRQKLQVQRIPLPDGKELALVRPDGAKVPECMPQTSWLEHLKAIREGKRELLDLQTVNSYTYEVLLEDGTKTLFNYGGSAPLDRIMETKKE
jgi:hypothetical protein